MNKPNLKQAMSYWRNQTKAFGLTGKISPHSLIGHNLILHRTKFYQKKLWIWAWDSKGKNVK
ncbi:integrase domain-containing protein [Gilliamella sp. A7]|uniref:integrase domain-containing protein n=1 Tax=Gilliamella sp. A7 TaxID=1970465 RepID=UPI00352A795C